MSYAQGILLAGVICLNCGNDDNSRALGTIFMAVGLGMQLWEVFRRPRE